MTEQISTLGVILAGGLSRRMGGGDKTMRTVAGRPILAHVIERLSPQCVSVILNANGDPMRFGSHGLTVVPDNVPDFAGPLAGVLAALDWTALHHPAIEWVVSVAADCPFLPRDLVPRMQTERAEKQGELAVAASGGQSHPVIGLWKVSLRNELRHALIVEECRKIGLWTARYRLVTSQWPMAPVDPFFNANTPEDVAQANALVQLAP